jgi:hypothetical protein
MKTFREFILICEKLNKTHDENSQSKIWNYFISNPDQQEIRDLLLRKDYKSAERLIKQEVERAKQDKNHPLNFQNAGDDEFSISTGRESSDEKPYNNFLDDSISGLLALSKEKKLRKSIERGLPSRGSGKSQAELSRRFSRSGGTDKTSKGDIEIFDPDNERFRVGISMKKGKGAQLASAESGELRGMVSSAAREYIKKFHNNLSREEKKKLEDDIMSRIGIVAQNQIDMRTADRDTQNELKNTSQEILDSLNKDYPQLTRAINQVATSGRGKFKSQQGTADVVLTGKEGDMEASVIPAAWQKSSNLRAALPKGRSKTTGISRPGNTKIDYKPEKESKSNQAQPQQGPITLSQFERRAKLAAAQDNEDIQRRREELRAAAAAQAQSEKALSKADRELEDANDELEASSVPIDPDTKKPVLRQFRKNIEGHMAADPTSRTSKLNSQRRRAAEVKVTNAQSNRDNVAATHDANVNAVQQAQQQQEPQETQPAPQQVQQPQATQQAPVAPVEQPPAPQPTQQQPQQPKPQETPQEPQQVAQQSPQDETERRRDTRRRMDAAGASLGPENRAQIPPEDLENKKKKAKEILSRMNDASQQ